MGRDRPYGAWRAARGVRPSFLKASARGFASDVGRRCGVSCALPTLCRGWQDCREFKNGTCSRGDSCRFNHVGEPAPAPDSGFDERRFDDDDDVGGGREYRYEDEDEVRGRALPPSETCARRVSREPTICFASQRQAVMPAFVLLFGCVRAQDRFDAPLPADDEGVPAGPGDD